MDKKNNEKISKFITIFIIIFIIILLMLCGMSFAKSIDNAIINANAQISEPILIIENNPQIDITAANNYGIYTFKIKNYNNENKITDINLKYYIEILSNLDESIEIELFQDENKIDLNNNKTEYIEISKDQKEERQYKIKVTYNKNKSTGIADILEKIQVKIHTEQVKA